MMNSRPYLTSITRIGLLALLFVISANTAIPQTGPQPPRERTDTVSAPSKKSSELQPVEAGGARVDQRVELLSIVFGLAGSPEYSANPLKKYADDIDQYFYRYAHHPAVERARVYIKKDGVGFDAVMSMAVILSPPPALLPRAPIGHGIPDARWGEDGGEQFIALLRAFYLDTHFERFFAEHRALYNIAEERFDSTIAQIDFPWFSRFFGHSTNVKFNFVLGMNNGPGFYGPHVRLTNNVTEIYAIIGCAPHDDIGNPIFPPEVLVPLVIHEFSHSFVNPAVDRRWKDFRGVKRVYESVAPQMEAQAYGDAKALVYESIVRAAVLIYFRDSGQSPVVTSKILRQEELRGFFWMPELVKNLELYESERAAYNNLDAWTPRLTRFYARLGGQIGARRQEFLQKVARIVVVKPAANHTNDVDPSLTSLMLETDKDVLASAEITVHSGAGALNPVSGTPYLLSSRQIFVRLNLKEHGHYKFTLDGASFETAQGYPLEPLTVEFSTR